MKSKINGDSVRWGILGVGDVCEVKSAPAMQIIENSEVVAVMRRNGEKAKDFAQEAFVVLWNHRKDLDIKLGLKPYLRQVVVNKCLNYLRREQRIDFSENSQLPETATSIDAIHHLEKEDLQKTIQQAVDNLPNRCRIIFSMSRYEEKSHKEISQALGISPKTVENQITIALKALRKAIYKIALFAFFKASV